MKFNNYFYLCKYFQFYTNYYINYFMALFSL